MSLARTVVIGDKLYCGGGETNDYDDVYRVFCYNSSKDAWSSLPACPVWWFGLGRVRGKLVTVGGKTKFDHQVTNEVYEFNEATQSWMRNLKIPPMTTARDSPAVLSHHAALIVAGGRTLRSRTASVEVFQEETSQWYTTDPLPLRWQDATTVLINNRWYLLGGAAEEEECSNRVACANVDLLLQNAVPSNRYATTEKGKKSSSAWEVLPNTMYYGPTAASLGGSLLAVGGTTSSNVSNPQVAVYVYSPYSSVWAHITDLPAPRMQASAAVLSSTELLLIGGCSKGSHLNTVYKGRC